MSSAIRSSPTIRDYFPPSTAVRGDGFTSDEIREALKPHSNEAWHPSGEYTDCEIHDLQPGPHAVTFMGRIANIYDIPNTSRSPRSAKGCVKLCVKDDGGTVTVRVWYAVKLPRLRLGSLVSVWAKHISNGENGTLASSSAPLFISIFPERDRTCHFMVHENSDNGTMCRVPLGFQEGQPLDEIMALRNFMDGGHELIGAKIVVIVRRIDERRTVTCKNGRAVEKANLLLQDHTAQATLGLWGTCAFSPEGFTHESSNTTNPEAAMAQQAWKANETVLLLQCPGYGSNGDNSLSINNSTIIDLNPSIPETAWLRRWAKIAASQEAANPPFPSHLFSLRALITNPIRSLYTLADLDDFARLAPTHTSSPTTTPAIYQGYLSVLVSHLNLRDHSTHHSLFTGTCTTCSTTLYTNDPTASKVACRTCLSPLRNLSFNPRILGPVIDETGTVASGKLLLNDAAWRDLLGRDQEGIAMSSSAELREIEEVVEWARVSLLFGFTVDETAAGGRVCVLGVRG